MKSIPFPFLPERRLLKTGILVPQRLRDPRVLFERPSCALIRQDSVELAIKPDALCLGATVGGNVPFTGVQVGAVLGGQIEVVWVCVAISLLQAVWMCSYLK
jgi:hypothetical protein